MCIRDSYLGASRLASGDAGGELALSKESYTYGETIEATAWLEDGLAMPWEEPSAAGFVESESGDRVDVVFTRETGQAGLYRARFPAGAAGRFKAAVIGPGGSVSSTFIVGTGTVEAFSREADREGLSALASATGGAVLEAESVGQIEELYPPQSESGSRLTLLPLWASWWFLLLTAGTLLAEWVLRKKWDLL